MANNKIDETDVLGNYAELLGHVVENKNEKLTEDERTEIKNNIKKLKNWVKEIKSAGEKHSDLKWKVKMLSEILECEKNTEIIPLFGNEIDEETKEFQKEHLEGIEEWLNDLKNELKK
jgi:DNA mismatch repair ATPase MutL